MRWRAVVLAAAAAALLAACGGDEPAPQLSPEPTSTPTEPAATQPPTTEAASPDAAVELSEVAVELAPVARLDAPTAMAVRPGDDRLYVAERGGVVRLIDGGDVSGDAVLDISGQVSTGGERGLLGIAFSADGDELYASFTNPDGDSRIIAYPMDGDRADPGRARELLAVAQPYANHNGGNVVLGPDEMLYVGLGDGGAANDPERRAQDPATLLGKMLRLDPADGSAPPDNPFVGDDDYAPEIFALGLRNPWRYSFDRETDDLWVADVGQNSVEEINVTPLDEAAGANYAWDIFEGSQPFEGDEQPDNAVIPVEEYPTGDGCAVTGGYVYRGSAIEGLQGAYLYGDYCAGFVRAVRVEDGEVVDRADLGVSAGELASFGEDRDGELYVLSLSGEVHRLVPAG